MKIIDLEDLINKGRASSTRDCSYDYFLCSRRGEIFVEPFKDASENNGLGIIEDDEMVVDPESDVEHDSNDSNREDAEQNDYPDEDSDGRSDDDEERAAVRYNKK